MDNAEDKKYSEQIEALNKLLTDHSKAQSATIRQLNRALVIVAICMTVIICCMITGFFWYESQFEVTEVTTTEMTTEGEDANINAVTNGDMYNDSSTHNE